MQFALFFLSLLFLAHRDVFFFRLNHVRKVWKRCSHSRFSFQTIILGIFLTKCWLVFMFFGCYGLFSLSHAMTRGERSVKWKRRQSSNRTRTIVGSPSSPPPAIRRACFQATWSTFFLIFVLFTTAFTIMLCSRKYQVSHPISNSMFCCCFVMTALEIIFFTLALSQERFSN